MTIRQIYPAANSIKGLAAKVPVILHLDPSKPDVVETFSGPEWRERMTEVAIISRERMMARFDLCVDARTVIDEEVGNEGLRLAIWCRDLAMVERLSRISGVETIVFSPDRVSVLDAKRLARRTLIVTVSLARNSEIRPEHIGEEDGGSGADTTLRAVFIGLHAAYDFAAGEPLDFGRVL